MSTILVILAEYGTSIDGSDESVLDALYVLEAIGDFCLVTYTFLSFWLFLS